MSKQSLCQRKMVKQNSTKKKLREKNLWNTEK